MRARVWLIVILAGYLLVTLAYSVVNPLFEAPDEHWHYFTAQYIKDERQLPFVGESYDRWLSQEAAQPPLYYLIGALLIAPVDTTEARERVWLNPFFYAGDAAVLTDLNQVIHTPAEAWPWQGVALAAHLLRFFSVLLGLGTLLAIYGCGRLVWPHDVRPALLATALVAFLPQFNFSQASISNDALITFLSAFALWQLLRLWQSELTWPRLLLLGLTGGVAALSKNAGILLLAFTIGVLFLRALKATEPALKRRLLAWVWQTALFILLPAALLAGWLWLRNLRLYGDITATEPFIRLAEGDRDFTLLQVLAETSGLVRSLVAVFGWFNLLAPWWIYAVWGGLLLFAGLGVLKAWLVRRRSRPVPPLLVKTAVGVGESERLAPLLASLRQPWFPAIILGLWLVLVYAGLVAFMLRTPAAQGRLLFPALVPLALALAYGLSRWRWSAIYWLAPGLALLTTLASCFLVIRPAYDTVDTLAGLPGSVEPLTYPFGGGVTLLAATIDVDTAVPGDTVWLDLYWQAEGAATEPEELVVELFGRQLDLLGSSHSYHGQGQFPSTIWPEKTVVADRVGLRIAETATVPVLARVFVRPSRTGVEAAHVASVKVQPEVWPNSAGDHLARVGETIGVTAAELSRETAPAGDAVTVDVTWSVIAAPEQTLTTLVHLAQPDQPPLATADNQPLHGEYPTSVWAAGEQIADQYVLVLPDELPLGRYPVWLGMYDATTIERQPLTVNGERQRNDLFQIGWLEVTE